MVYNFHILILINLLVNPIFAQLPRLDVTQLTGKQILVTKVSVTPLKGTSNDIPYHYIIRDSTMYTAMFESVHQNSDSTLMVTLLIKDLYKVILYEGGVLATDSLQQYQIEYLTDLNGTYLEAILDQKLAHIEGYFGHFEDDDPFNLTGNEILWTYRSGLRYWRLEEIKYKVLQELFWIHLFPALQPYDEKYWKSSQAVYLDLKMDRIPSKLSLVREGEKILIHQEIDVQELYRGMVTEEELQIIADSDPADFFIRIYSDAEYKWDDKLNIPQEIKATLITSLKDEGKEYSMSKSYKIEFSPN